MNDEEEEDCVPLIETKISKLKDHRMQLKWSKEELKKEFQAPIHPEKEFFIWFIKLYLLPRRQLRNIKLILQFLIFQQLILLFVFVASCYFYM